MPQLGHTSSVASIAISPDGRTALSGGSVTDNTLRLWDLASGREIRKFEGHTSAVHSIAIAPDGKTALSGGGDNTLRLWDLASGREIGKFEVHSGSVNAVAIAPDRQDRTVGGNGRGHFGPGDSFFGIWPAAASLENSRGIRPGSTRLQLRRMARPRCLPAAAKSMTQ